MDAWEKQLRALEARFGPDDQDIEHLDDKPSFRAQKK
jgi:hypothetical protein